MSVTEVIKNRGFANLWLNQALVQFAYNMLNFTLIIWVFQLTNSNIAVSVLMFCIYLPAVLFGLFAGILVDIADRKKVIMAVNLFLSICFLALVFLKGYYLAILTIAFLINTLAQLYNPAESSSIPLLVKAKQLMSANSLFSITLFSTFLLGFGFAGPIIEFFGINSAFAIGAIATFLAFLLSFLFPSIRSELDTDAAKLRQALKKRKFSNLQSLSAKEIKFTLQMVSKKVSLITAICIMAGVQVVIALLAVLVPGFLEDVIHINATNASYVMVIPLGVGMVAGGLVLSKFGHLLPKRRIVTSAIMTAGAIFFFAGVAPIVSPAIQYLHIKGPLPFFYQIPLSLILAGGAFLLGICLVAINVPSQTVLQEYTPETHRGKVFSVLAVAMAGFSLIPVLLAGAAADLVGTMPILMVLGSIVFIAGVVALRPNLFFKKNQLSSSLSEFLGRGHWKQA